MLILCREGSYSPFVLKNIDLTIPYGKVTAIVGASGSGKTTLMKLILIFYKPNMGRVLIGENDLIQCNTDLWRSHCGVVCSLAIFIAVLSLKI